jgi:hypothetical protein
MANPIITADQTTINLTPGASVTIEASATDPDAGTTTLHITGTDGQGNAATVDVTVQKADPIVTWAVTSDDPDIVAGFTAQGGTGATVVASWPTS